MAERSLLILKTPHMCSKDHTCWCFTTHITGLHYVWVFPHICGDSHLKASTHICLVFTTHVCLSTHTWQVKFELTISLFDPWCFQLTFFASFFQSLVKKCVIWSGKMAIWGSSKYEACGSKSSTIAETVSYLVESIKRK